jgi:ATP-dependent RNA helicase DeaD
MGNFNTFGLSAETLNIIRRKGFEEPTPIQEKIIPMILRGNKDVVGQAQTGTGKTAAFGLPIIELLREKSRNVQVLVLTPTRELAIQVAEEINSLKGKKRLNIVPIYGGQSIELQLRSLARGIDIVVGTPGRILDHVRRKTLRLDKISYLVLDEADEMLNMGFLEDVTAIMEKTAYEKRTMLFSATMPQEIMGVAKKYMGEYEIVRVGKGQLTVSQTDQIYFEVSRYDKFEALCRIIDIEEEFYGLVFCRTKNDVDNIANSLVERGYNVDGLHGDMTQFLREKILNKFKKKIINILVATDVAARGIDVQDLTHVINYSLPHDPESYVHRIGRTGRAGKEGIAITFVTPAEYRKLQYIMREAKTDIRKAKLPGVKDVMDMKREKVKSILEKVVEVHPSREYFKMSRELLEDKAPIDIVAALLKHAFGDELDSRKYSEIEDAVVDKKGKTRLFVTQGSKDGLTHKKLVKFIKEKAGIRSDKIKDVQILDKFSFMVLPFHEAEMLLSAFKGSKKGAGPFITKAKSKRK